MTWIVGLDAHGRCHGAVRFARWFLSHVEAHAAPIVGLHMVDLTLFGPLVGEVSTDQLETAARTHLGRLPAELGLDPKELEVEVAPTDSIAHALTEQCHTRHAEGIIIGRKAPRQSKSVVRLGRVARQLLRELPVTVLVVPPDHDPRDQKGPIVVATGLGDESAAAAQLALHLAKPLGRAIVVTHTVLGIEQRVRPWFPDLPHEDVEKRIVADANRQLDQWCRDHGLAGAQRQILVGDPLVETRDLLDRIDACLCIVGSRRLGVAARAVRVSFGSHLAATASCPIGLVAPDAEKQATRLD